MSECVCECECLCECLCVSMHMCVCVRERQRLCAEKVCVHDLEIIDPLWGCTKTQSPCLDPFCIRTAALLGEKEDQA